VRAAKPWCGRPLKTLAKRWGPTRDCETPRIQQAILAQVAQYIACRDGVSVAQSKKAGKKDGNFDTWTPGK